MSEFRIEEGCWYRTRAGAIDGPVIRNVDDLLVRLSAELAVIKESDND